MGKEINVSSKVVVVTGASMGIGEALARIFADHGARVVLLSRDAGRAEAARDRVGHTERTLALSCDVRNREEIDRVLSLTLHHFNRIDVWINNAGHGLLDSVAQLDMTACRETVDTNFFGAVESMLAVIPVMKQQGAGTIINISQRRRTYPASLPRCVQRNQICHERIRQGSASGTEELRNSCDDRLPRLRAHRLWG